MGNVLGDIAAMAGLRPPSDQAGFEIPYDVCFHRLLYVR